MGDLSLRRPGGGVDWTDLGEIGPETWAVAEEAAKEVVGCVHPTLDSEEKRKDVIEFIQKLIRDKLGFEIFPYGSVPLKTYLPDGDIDLTALCTTTAMDTLPHDVLDVLQHEENNQKGDYKVKDTQFINAEVKLVKCLVQNVVVDLSFNQLGGLCTLCFLEQVDRHVGKNHLFKRSIILVKTWCYYESRILGAHHGLISTYAMETLVLYIFHLFHASLDGPLAVLYKFLDYFSKFDWDNYCISLNGPVSKSCLPDIIVDMPHGVQNDDLLNEEFLTNCIDMFSVPFMGSETSLQEFTPKHLNIIDPLKENNNLGRSVNRGNFYRIRSAFRYGARKLGRILTLPGERIGEELRRFFANTFERHGHSDRNLAPLSHSISFSEERIQFNPSSLCKESKTAIRNFEVDRCFTEINHMPMASKMRESMDEIDISGSLPAGEMYRRSPNYQLDCSASAWYASDSVSQYYTPCFQYSESFAESGTLNNWMLNEGNPAKNYEKADSDFFIEGQKDNHLRPYGVSCYHNDNYDCLSNFSSEITSPDEFISEDLGLDFREKDLVDVAGSPENSNPLSDLSGDYDSHIRSLFYAQCCHRHASSAPLMPHPPPTFASQFASKKPWNIARRSMSMTQCSSSSLIDNKVNMGWATQPGNVPERLNPAFCIEEKHHKSRGTGTYIPNGCVWERPSHGRGRFREPGNYRQFQRTSSAPIVPEKKSSAEGDTNHDKLPIDPCNSEKTEIPQQFHTSAFDESQTSNFVYSLQKLEFGSLGNLSDNISLPASDSSSGWCSIPKQVKNSESLFASKHERVGNHSYRLKEEDFPPLTV